MEHLTKQCSKCNQIKSYLDFITGRNICKSCQHLYNQEHRRKNKDNYLLREKNYRIQNKERMNASRRKWRINNPDKQKEAIRKYNSKNKDHHKDYILKRKYKISLDQYNQMLKEQNGVCAICHTKGNKEYLYVDHNHQTNKVRGLLCQNCNSAIGQLKEDPERFYSALEYLKRNN